MELVKIRDIRNGAIIEVKKTLLGDYIGTGRFELYEEKKDIKKEEKPVQDSFRETDAKYRY